MNPPEVIIIGAGSTGSALAHDLAMRGLRVGLVEQHDFAFGTSSRSSRLLHGGLRYLAQGRVGTLAEVPASGGEPRELLGVVASADWAPDGENIAVSIVGHDGAKLQLPPGRTVHSSRGAIRLVRVSPRGDRILYPNKKMTLDQHAVVINELSSDPRLRILLHGGPEDTGRNAQLAGMVGDRAVNTPTTEGVRRGLCYINACDVVVSGDSFGMHAAIGLRKHVIAWFGLSGPRQ